MMLVGESGATISPLSQQRVPHYKRYMSGDRAVWQDSEVRRNGGAPTSFMLRLFEFLLTWFSVYTSMYTLLHKYEYTGLTIC